MSRIASLIAALALGLAIALCPAGSASAAGGHAVRLTRPQADYERNCGGCHGIEGTSAPADVPVLRDRVGYFMCSAEGRDYLIRLPNVAFSRIADNAELAAMMNFVVFGLGGKSAPAGARPFDATEVAALRRRPMTTPSLAATRAGLVGRLIRDCGAPPGLDAFYAGDARVHP